MSFWLPLIRNNVVHPLKCTSSRHLFSFYFVLERSICVRSLLRGAITICTTATFGENPHFWGVCACQMASASHPLPSAPLRHLAC